MIDTTNSVRTRPEPHPTVLHYLKAECGLEKVVKCFNSTGFENMANPVYDGKGIDMFAAGSHAEAKAVARQLATDIGFGTCWDCGDDDKVELLEKFALSWINSWPLCRGTGGDWHLWCSSGSITAVPPLPVHRAWPGFPACFSALPVFL